MISDNPPPWPEPQPLVPQTGGVSPTGQAGDGWPDFTNDPDTTRDNQPMPPKYDPAKTAELLQNCHALHPVYQSSYFEQRLVDQLSACEAERARLQVENEKWRQESHRLTGENERQAGKLAAALQRAAVDGFAHDTSGTHLWIAVPYDWARKSGIAVGSTVWVTTAREPTSAPPGPSAGSAPGGSPGGG